MYTKITFKCKYEVPHFVHRSELSLTDYELFRKCWDDYYKIKNYFYYSDKVFVEKTSVYELVNCFNYILKFNVDDILENDNKTNMENFLNRFDNFTYKYEIFEVL